MSEREKKKLLTKLQSLFNGIYKIEDNGYLIHPTFQTLPLRSGTDYYKVVQNPLSLHAVGRKLKNLKYADAQEFINDLALISWNARFYNHSKSVIYRQAQILKQYITDVVIPKLKNDKAVPNGHSLIYPHIGDLPDDRDNDELLGFSFEKGESTPGPSGASNAGSRRDEFEMSATLKQIQWWHYQNLWCQLDTLDCRSQLLVVPRDKSTRIIKLKVVLEEVVHQLLINHLKPVSN